MRSEEEKKEQRRKAQKKYYEKNKEYYRKQSIAEVKRVRKERNLYKNIIKEVREYIEENWISQKDADNYRFDDAELIIEINDIAVLFDILDKGKE